MASRITCTIMQIGTDFIIKYLLYHLNEILCAQVSRRLIRYQRI